MPTLRELQFAKDILDIRKTCKNCYHWRNNDCALCSCECATQVSRRAINPSRWMSYEEGEELERRFQTKSKQY